MTERCLIIVITLTLNSDSCQPRSCQAPGTTGKPLILTTMIEDGDIETAQDLCKVKPLLGDIKSYAGFLTVDKTYNSNLFFWFFPSASEDDNTAPVIVWLYGGVGFPSMNSIFLEVGPYIIEENLSLALRKPSLTDNFSDIYIDAPVGAGFSYTDDDEGFSKDFIDVGYKLYSALVQFFRLFPQYEENDFYLVGESFGGKCVTAASYVIHTNNPTADVQINLKGLAIGSALLDLNHMIHYGDYFYQIGLIDSDGQQLFYEAEQDMLRLVQNEEYLEAYDVYDRTISGFNSKSTLLRDLTGFHNIDNYLHSARNNDDYYLVFDFLTQPKIREAIHVGNASYDLCNDVLKHLKGDISTSAKPWLEELLDNNYRVLLYDGQLDLFIPYPLTEELVANLDWSRAAEFSEAPRTQWYVGNDLAGYSKEGGNLNLVLVRNAGQYAPTDQPKWSLDMITRFIRNERLAHVDLWPLGRSFTTSPLNEMEFQLQGDISFVI